MKTNMVHYKNQKEYLNRNKGKILKEEKPKIEKKKNIHKKSIDPKDLKKSLKEKAQKAAESLGKAGKYLLSDAQNVAQNALLPELKNFLLPNTAHPIPLPSLSASISSIETRATPPDSTPTPNIYIFSGFEWGGLSSDKNEASDLLQAFPSAEKVSWQDQNKILQKIKKMPIEDPLILVGHSLGGDSVVNIANTINSPEYGYRRVDLLVTLDSVGFNNDIIPDNVHKNMNFIGDKDLLFNDGPNIAYNNRVTDVYNELRKEGHQDIDESKDIQKKIYFAIKEITSDLLGPKKSLAY